MDPSQASPELQQFLARESQIAQVQQMISTLSDVCWDKCISSPGSYMSSKETTCLDNCAKRFVETTQFILQRASHKSESSSGSGFIDPAMGQHRLPAIANRLRLNRGFESAWYSDFHYAQLLQKDWLLSRAAQSLVQRSSRSRPKQRLTLSQQLQLLERLRAAKAEGRELDVQAAAAEAVAASTSGQAQGLSMCDYPNQRVGRIFMQQLPYKSIVSTFAYSVPEQGPQNKYDTHTGSRTGLQGIPLCSHCAKRGQKLKLCSGCKQAYFCGPECQRAGWQAHKKECKAAAAAKK